MSSRRRLVQLRQFRVGVAHLESVCRGGRVRRRLHRRRTSRGEDGSGCVQESRAQKLKADRDSDGLLPGNAVWNARRARKGAPRWQSRAPESARAQIRDRAVVHVAQCNTVRCGSEQWVSTLSDKKRRSSSGPSCPQSRPDSQQSATDGEAGSMSTAVMIGELLPCHPDQHGTRYGRRERSCGQNPSPRERFLR